MAEGRCAQQWKHTSAVLAVLLNANRARGDRPLRPADLDPYHEAEPQSGTADVTMKPSEFARIMFGSKGKKEQR